MNSSARRAAISLYSGPQDLHSHRVRLVLAEKQLDYRLIEVVAPDLPEDLIDLNPTHSVPTLVDRDLVAYDGCIIVEYLDDRFPHPPLMPGDPAGRAQLRMALQRFEQDWYTLVTELESRPRRDGTTRRLLQERILSALPLFGVRRWLVSDDYSLVDCTVAPVLWRLAALEIEIPAGAEAITRYAEAVFARPAFRRSLLPAEVAMRR